MAYDSRRWTGRYAPGETPPEFAGGRPYRSRALRWWLLVAVLGSPAIAIGQLWMPTGRGMAIGWFAATAAINLPAGRSPFARRRGYAGSYDEFESAALSRATQRAYWLMVILAAAALGWCGIASAHALPMPHRWNDWAVWAIALVAIASNLPTLLAEFAIPFPAEDEAS